MNSMDRLKQEKNRGYVIAGGAAIVAFIAFFLPYVSVSGTYFNVGSISVNGATVGSWLWLEFLGLLIVGAVSALFLFRDTLLSGTIKMPLDKQVTYGKYLLLGASILALLVHLLFLASYSAYTNGYGGLVSVHLGFGFWLFMLAAIAMIVGSVFALRKSAPSAAQTYGQANGQQYSTQYPPQPVQYPPYQQAYPPQPQQGQPPYSQTQQPYQPYPQDGQPPYSQTQQSQQPQQPYPSYQQPQQPYPPYPQTQPPYQQQPYPPIEMQQPPQQP
ncbi:MAG TPA: hypothetical protein DHW02_05265 [Ktedonobacter sp.]|nr:hypothetical protein [Ktedonobacter sp.]